MIPAEHASIEALELHYDHQALKKIAMTDYGFNIPPRESKTQLMERLLPAIVANQGHDPVAEAAKRVNDAKKAEDDAAKIEADKKAPEAGKTLTIKPTPPALPVQKLAPLPVPPKVIPTTLPVCDNEPSVFELPATEGGEGFEFEKVRDLVIKTLKPYTDAGLILKFHRETAAWHMQHGRQSDSGTMRQPLRHTQRAAFRLMPRLGAQSRA